MALMASAHPTDSLLQCSTKSSEIRRAAIKWFKKNSRKDDQTTTKKKYSSRFPHRNTSVLLKNCEQRFPGANELRLFLCPFCLTRMHLFDGHCVVVVALSESTDAAEASDKSAQTERQPSKYSGSSCFDNDTTHAQWAYVVVFVIRECNCNWFRAEEWS